MGRGTTRRNDLGRAIRAAEWRLELSLQRGLVEPLGAELRTLRARQNWSRESEARSD